METSSIQLSKCCSWDCGTQRCRIHVDRMRELDLRTGDYVFLNSNRHSYVCRVYASNKKSSHKNVIVFDGTISANTIKHDKVGILIRKLKVREIDVVNINVIVGSIDDVETCSEHHLKEILLQYGFLSYSFIDCKKHPLGELLGLHKIEIVLPESERDVHVLSKHCSVNIHRVYTEEEFDLERGHSSCGSLVGLEKPYRLLQNYFNVFSHPSHKALGLNRTIGILVDGPSGCGKTVLIKKITRDNKFLLSYVLCGELASSNPGETEKRLRESFDRAHKQAKRLPTVLFFDDVDVVSSVTTNVSTGSTHSASTALISMFNEYKETDQLLIIGATSRPLALDPALRQPNTFDHQVSVRLPDVDSRCKILSLHLTPFSLSDTEIYQLAEQTHGSTASDLASIVQLTLLHSLQQKTTDQIQLDDFIQVLQHFRPAIQKNNGFICSELRPTYWESIGGLEDVKDLLKIILNLSFKNHERRMHFNLPPLKGILLYGPPGCCKTTIVRAVATEANAAFFALSAADIYSQFVGDSEKAVAEVFRVARAWSPSIIFLDEIDAIVGSRNDKQKGGVQEKVLSTLLNEMDGIGIHQKDSHHSVDFNVATNAVDHKNIQNANDGILVIAATNRPDRIDKALLRPGRFDRHLYIPPPDLEARKDILRILIAALPTECIDLSSLAEKTDGFTGADLKNLCREAALTCARENNYNLATIIYKHFFDALSQVMPSVTKSESFFYKNLF